MCTFPHRQCNERGQSYNGPSSSHTGRQNVSKLLPKDTQCILLVLKVVLIATLQHPGICQHLDQDFLSSDLINGYGSIYSYGIPCHQFYFRIKPKHTREPISLTQATEKRLWLTSTYFMIGFSNCLAHLHCRMQDKQ